ncbi:MAG TPA: hypothetical protein VIM16_13545 [Mucilaginibacter sp.]
MDNFKNSGRIQTKQDKADYNKAVDSLRHHFRQIAFEYFNQSLFYKTTADSIRKRVLTDVAKTDTTIATACMEQNDFDEVKKLTAVKKKLYLINSDYTPTNTTGFKTYHIPYKVFYIHATGHFPMIEKPQVFNSTLKQIIAEI